MGLSGEVGRVSNDPLDVIAFLASSCSTSVSESSSSRSSKLTKGREVLCSTAASSFLSSEADSSRDRGILTSSAVFHGCESSELSLGPVVRYRGATRGCFQQVWRPAGPNWSRKSAWSFSSERCWLCVSVCFWISGGI